ncbi:MAG TPA: hypothetical protein VGD75_06940, partial [Bradyrhizobium sp.]
VTSAVWIALLFRLSCDSHRIRSGCARKPRLYQAVHSAPMLPSADSPVPVTRLFRLRNPAKAVIDCGSE